MSDINKKTKGNKSIIFGTAILTVGVAVAAYFVYNFYNTPQKVEGNIASLSENFDSLAETGLLLVNQGSMDFEEIATETQTSQINFFENGGLSETSSNKNIYKLATTNSPEGIVEKFDTIGLKLELVEEESSSMESGYVNETYRNVSDKGYHYVRMAFSQQGQETMRWEYANDVIMTETSWCPDVTKPLVENYKNPGVDFEEIPLNIMSLPESKIRELINLDSYNAELSNYEEQCGDFLETLASENVFKSTVEEFLNLIGLNSTNHSYVLNVDEPKVNVEVYENLNGSNIGPVANFALLSDGTSIAYAEGFHYEVANLGKLETISPSESVFRTEQYKRILGIIDSELYNEYSIVGTTQPTPGQTYNMDKKSEDIYVLTNTIDGLYALPGYILTDSSQKTSIYVVSLSEDVFAPIKQ